MGQLITDVENVFRSLGVDVIVYSGEREMRTEEENWTNMMPSPNLIEQHSRLVLARYAQWNFGTAVNHAPYVDHCDRTEEGAIHSAWLLNQQNI